MIAPIPVPHPASGPTQTARYERKREAILEAAAALFNARGLAGTTIADVAKAVGLTTTSVTYYYRKKEDLAAACLMRAIGAMDDILSQAEAGAAQDRPAERLTRFVRLYFSHLADTAAGRAPQLINFWDLRGMTGPQGAGPMQAFVALFRRMRRLFQAGAPLFSRNEQNARAHLVFAAVIGAKTWVRRYETDDYPRAAERFAEVLIGGLAGAGSVWGPLAIDLLRPNLQRARPDAAEVSREAFLRAATELINENGYRGASVDRISARLNVTKGSFYHHNATKDELVGDCFERTFEILRQAHRAVHSLGGDGWTKTCALACALVRHQLSDQGPLLRYSALAAAPADRRAELWATSERLTERTAGLISDGVADGSIRPVDAVVAAEILMGLINAAAELEKWSPAATEATCAELFVRPLFLGVFTG
jgi:AcrR family transcriptional regulator